MVVVDSKRSLSRSGLRAYQGSNLPNGIDSRSHRHQGLHRQSGGTMLGIGLESRAIDRPV
jgi:hypothetical protein